MSEKSDKKPDSAPSPIGEISQEPSAFEAFLDANQKKLMIVGILAIIALIGYVVFDGLKDMQIREDSALVAAARTVPDYEAAAKELEGKVAGGSALFLKAQLLWDDQQQNDAVEAVQAFISAYPEHPAIGSAYATLGSYLQVMGNAEEAKVAFEKSVETKSAASSMALLNLGDIALQAGDGDKAKAYYDQILTEYEESHFNVKSLARQRLELVGVEAPTEKKPEPKPDSPSLPGAPTPGLPVAPTPGLPVAPAPGIAPSMPLVPTIPAQPTETTEPAE